MIALYIVVAGCAAYMVVGPWVAQRRFKRLAAKVDNMTQAQVDRHLQLHVFVGDDDSA